jgi:hypothetical protein
LAAAVLISFCVGQQWSLVEAVGQQWSMRMVNIVATIGLLRCMEIYLHKLGLHR